MWFFVVLSYVLTILLSNNNNNNDNSNNNNNNNNKKDRVEKDENGWYWLPEYIVEPRRTGPPLRAGFSRPPPRRAPGTIAPFVPRMTGPPAPPKKTNKRQKKSK
jgi:hypothetical protein